MTTTTQTTLHDLPRGSRFLFDGFGEDHEIFVAGMHYADGMVAVRRVRDGDESIADGNEPVVMLDREAE